MCLALFLLTDVVVHKRESLLSWHIYPRFFWSELLTENENMYVWGFGGEGLAVHFRGLC